MSRRQVVLDTETTGLETSDGHRIIEIGCVELLDRRLTGRHYHRYLNPERDIDEGARAVHGISLEDLADKPRFAEVAEEFIEFIAGADLVIHNAAFDVGFIDHELALLGSEHRRVADLCTVIDSLALARHKHPGQKNSLDALCSRYGVDNSERTLHGALLDAEILADVYLLLTGGQTSLLFDPAAEGSSALPADGEAHATALTVPRGVLPVVRADAAELQRHAAVLESIGQDRGAPACWPVAPDPGS